MERNDKSGGRRELGTNATSVFSGKIRSYAAPILVKRERLSEVTASSKNASGISADSAPG
jgi:hypothetical protein